MPLKVDDRHKVVGGRHRALSRYYMMLSRVKNSHLPKNRKYEGVEVRVDKEEFITWFQARDFAGCSVDRIDPNGHYELSNMQVIDGKLNAGKDKVLLNDDGTRTCSVCKLDKPLSEFVKDKRRLILGVASICLVCERKRK
ncbi:hypothetical protein [Stenotrophomonas phage BUCTxx99]|nr:hypothetical protein [Stenotrophomonas phage BUCTxx99]